MTHLQVRQVTARCAQGACALEDVESQGLTGVADLTGVFRVLSPTVVAGVPVLVGRDEAMGLLVRCREQSQEGLGQVGWACGKSHGHGVAAGRRRWEAPEGAYPSKRLVEFLADCLQPPLFRCYGLQTPQITLGSPRATRRHWKRI